MSPTAPFFPRLFNAGLLGYILADLAGMLLIALGGVTLVTGSPLLLLGVPQTFLGAIACIVVGFILVFWALARILVAVTRQAQPHQRQHS